MPPPRLLPAALLMTTAGMAIAQEGLPFERVPVEAAPPPVRAVPWVFPPRPTWLTVSEQLTVRVRRDVGPLRVYAEGREEPFAAHDHMGDLVAHVPLAMGNQTFRVVCGDHEAQLRVGRAGRIQGADRFLQRWAEADTWFARQGALRGLSPEDPEHWEILQDTLRTQPWYYRRAVAETLAQRPAVELAYLFSQALANDELPAVILEGLLQAAGILSDDSLFESVAACLGHRKSRVQAAAITALAKLQDPRAMPLLLEAWRDHADDPLLASQARTAVRYLSGVHDLLEPPETLEVRLPPPTAVLEALRWATPDRDVYEAGVGPLRYVLRVRGDLTAKRGLLVVCEFGLGSEVLAPYLEQLEAGRPVVYVELPPQGDSETYPLDAVSRGLQRVLRDLRERHVFRHAPCVLTQGLASWVVQSIATRDPKATQKQILVSPFTSRVAYREATARAAEYAARAPEPILARHLKAHPQAPLLPWNDPWASAYGFTLLFADDRNPEIGRALGFPLADEQRWSAQRRIGELRLPAFSLLALPAHDVLTVVLVGGYDLNFEVPGAAEKLVTHLGDTSRLFTFRRSGRMPWIEENELFQKILLKLLDG